MWWFLSKPYPILDHNEQNLYQFSDQKERQTKDQTFLGGTYLNRVCSGVPISSFQCMSLSSNLVPGDARCPREYSTTLYLGTNVTAPFYQVPAPEFAHGAGVRDLVLGHLNSALGTHVHTSLHTHNFLLCLLYQMASDKAKLSKYVHIYISFIVWHEIFVGVYFCGLAIFVFCGN